MPTFFGRALTQGASPVELTTDRAPVYPRVIEEFVPAARHVLEQPPPTDQRNSGVGGKCSR
jgi:hypothetical protein